MTIGCNAPHHHIHQAGRRPAIPETLKRARQRGLGRPVQLSSVSQENKTLLSGLVPVAAAAVIDSDNRFALNQAATQRQARRRTMNLQPRPMWTNTAAPPGSATERLIYEYGAWSAMGQVQQARHSPRAVAQQLLRRQDIDEHSNRGVDRPNF